MTMSEKIKRRKSKKAFTLVELVIVIAILAILAAIAIPVITTTINSAKLSTMQSDSATIEMLIKEAINTSKAGIYMEYNGHLLTSATVRDVLVQNHVNLDVMSVKKVNGIEYAISWSKAIQGTVIISGTHITPYNIGRNICTLE